MKLLKNSGYNDSVVLQNPWPSKIIVKHLAENDISEILDPKKIDANGIERIFTEEEMRPYKYRAGNIIFNYSSQVLYVSLKIKTLENIFENGAVKNPNDVVLKVKIPANIINSDGSKQVGNLRFYELPSPNNNEIESVTNNNIFRGNRRNLFYNACTDPTKDKYYEMNITRSMLCEENGFITISGMIIMMSDINLDNTSNYLITNKPDYVINEDFKKNFIVNSTAIKAELGWDFIKSGFSSIHKIIDLGLEITYVGNADIALESVKFETPHTRELLWGEHDQEIKTTVQQVVSRVPPPQVNTTSWTAYPFKFDSYIEGGSAQWQGLKYVKNLAGDIFTGQTGTHYDKLFNHYVNIKDRWFAISKNRSSRNTILY